MRSGSITPRLTALTAAIGATAALIAAVPAAANAKVDRAGAKGLASVRAAIEEPPMRLPRGGATTAGTRHDWLIGVRPTATAERLVRRAGGRPLPVHGTWRVPVGSVRGLARRLEADGLLVWAQENPIRRRKASFDGQEHDWARAAVVPPTLAPPPPGVPIGIVDELVDPQNPDVGGQTRHVNGAVPLAGPHGTEVASVAAGMKNGTGVTGVLPGSLILSYGLTDRSCADSATGIATLVEAGARVINMSIGGPACYAEWLAVTAAHASGVLVVAAAGNEFQQGNPVSYPAAYPHVLSVAAVDRDLRHAAFSTANDAVDLAAPGVGVPVSLPIAFDVEDGTQDGLTLADGTSFSAPMAAGAAAWLLAARGDISPAQAADLLRGSARDVGPRGWDPFTGHGLLDVAAALEAPAPPLDPAEPNDAIALVDGTVFGTPHGLVWSGVGRRSLAASVDAAKDPVDVYRVRIPARANVTIVLEPRYGNPDLYVFDGAAKSVDDQPIAASRRGQGQTDTIRLANPTGRARTAHVAVGPSTSAGASLDASYRLKFRRQR